MALLGPSAPVYQQPTLPNFSDQAISNVVGGQTNATPGSVAQQSLNGTQGSGAMVSNFGQQAQNEQNSLGGGGMPGMAAAIQNKQMKNYNISQGALGQQANLYGQQQAYNLNTQAANTVNQLSTLEMGAANYANAASIATQGARNAVVSGIFQGAGALGGIAAAGGFGGGSSPSNYQATVQGATDMSMVMPQMGEGGGFGAANGAGSLGVSTDLGMGGI